MVLYIPTAGVFLELLAVLRHYYERDLIIKDSHH